MISVIIPALNAEAALSQTLNSVGEDVEVLLIDDGSTDNTAVIAREAGAIIVSSDPGRGRQCCR